MLRRSNKRKDKPDNTIENKPMQKEPQLEEPMSREDFIKSNADAQRVFADIEQLKQKVEALKQANVNEVPEEIINANESTKVNDTEAIVAAKKAVLEQAKKDALAEQAKREELLKKEEEARLQREKVLEAQRRAALVEAEAEKKRRQAEEAERIAKETARKAALEAMEAERKAKAIEKLQQHPEDQEEAKEVNSFFDTNDTEQVTEQDLETVKQELVYAQKQQEATLGLMSLATEHHANKLAEVQQEKLSHQTELLQKEKEKLIHKQKALEERRLREERASALKAEKIAKAQALRAEKLAKAQAEKAAKLAKLQAEKQARIAKAQEEKKARAAALLEEKKARAEKLLAEREERRIKEEKRRLEKQRKSEERDLLKRAKKDPEARAQLEKLRLEAKSKADAELGGGVVNVQGMTINTEIKEVTNITWRDLFSIRSKKERKADTEHEKRKLEKERKHRAEQARRAADISWRNKLVNYQKTKFAKKLNTFKRFCDNHKVGLLTAFAIVLLVLVGTAGVFNYYTAYSYSYNGKTLGIVKEKDDVLRITNLVQGALTEDKNVDVIIDTTKDIEFERVAAIGDVKIDTSEDVLKRLTYMDDLNVKAYGIFVEGKRVGVVENKSVAEEVFRDLEERYTSDMEDAEILEIEILESWEGKKCNASLENVLTKDEMVNVLCSDQKKESLHTVAVDETIEDIAMLYSMKEEEILKDNPNIGKSRLKAGDKLVIKKEAPVLTVKITEKVTYDKVIEHEVNKKDSKEIYEGYSETKQEGKDGLSQITSEITLVNGEQKNEDVLEKIVKKEPVTEIILIGVKERPPSVGSGKYIWPFESGYTLTSGFKWRWGRLHQGIDLGTPVGNDVLAADGGIVTYAGYSGAYGYLIKIDHQNGMETRYAHNSQLLVSTGDKVFQGMHIAESGNTGRSTGPHLHFEIRVGGTPKDPLGFLP